MIHVHSGAWRDFEPEISQVIPDAVMPEALASGKPRSESNQITSIGEFDPGSG
jgi:hypothetical protein